jgi:hypothetical protein
VEKKLRSNSWRYIVKEPPRVRKFILIEFLIEDRYFYILELERSGNEYGIYILYKDNELYSIVDEDNLRDFMLHFGKTAAFRSKVSLKEHNWILVSMKHHKGENSSMLAARIYSCVKSIFNSKQDGSNLGNNKN